jgi:non-specific serine/threonine protein kinase
MESMDSFGSWIKTRRQGLRLSQDNLAQQVGCALVTLRKIESDERRPSVQIAERLAAFLEIPLEMRADFVRAARAEISVRRLRMPDEREEASPAPSRRLVAIPVPRTPTIGRDREIAEISRRLLEPAVGLLTLTGPPGVGKTRLSQQVALGVGASFADGVVYIPLAAVREPGLVLSVIAQALGVKERSTPPIGELTTAFEPTSQALLDGLKLFCARKRLLLVLDNFEQVVEAAPILAELLAAAPGLKLLVTSREALHISSEVEIAVAPLELPAPDPAPAPERLRDVAAIELFVQRARAAQADFSLTPANAPAVVEICTRLDGLPLAIELAAARIKVLSPEALLARLTNRLHILTAGMRDVPSRHQTLGNAIAWSYELLTPDEQRLFRQLAVFCGGSTLAAIEALGAHQVPGVLDVLASLVDKSLVKQRADERGEPRFLLLETIREYAHEQLVAEGEQASAEFRHAAYYLELAETAERQLQGPQQIEWLERLSIEHDNIRAALGWALTQADPLPALRFGVALWMFWQVRGFLSEGRAWLDAILRHAPAPSVERGRILNGAGMMACNQSDVELAERMCQESLDMARRFGDEEGIAHALNNLGTVAMSRCEYGQTITYAGESLDMARRLGLDWLQGWALITSGYAYYELQQPDRARSVLEEGLAVFRRLGGLRGEAFALLFLGSIAQSQRDYDLTETDASEGLLLYRALHDVQGIAFANELLAYVARSRGQLERAEALLGESIELLGEQDDTWRVAWMQMHLSQVVLRRGDQAQAARLLAAAVTVARHYDDPELLGLSFTRGAELLVERAEPGRAAALLASVAPLIAQHNVELRGIDDESYSELVERLGQLLAPEARPAARELSQSRGVAESVEEVLAVCAEVAQEG